MGISHVEIDVLHRSLRTMCHRDVASSDASMSESNAEICVRCKEEDQNSGLIKNVQYDVDQTIDQKWFRRSGWGEKKEIMAWVK